MQPEIRNVMNDRRPWSHIVAAAGLLLGACSSERVSQPPAPPVNWGSLEPQPVIDAGPPKATESERRLPVVFAAALSSPGFVQLGPLLDEDAHFSSPGLDDAHGRTAVVHALDVAIGAFDDRKFALERIWRTANEQTIEWTMTGTCARDWLGVAATHTSVTFRGLTLLWTKDDGSISDIHLYFDVTVVKAQLGAGPKGLTAPPLPPAGKEEPKIFEQSVSPQEKSNVVAYEAALDALERKDLSRYVDAMTDDVEVTTLERAQPWRGKDDAKAYFKSMHKAIGQLDTTVQNAWGVSDRLQFVIVEYFIAGEQLGPILWIPAQRDKVIRLQVVDIAEMRDGKIARVWRYDNPAQIIGSGL
jgi:ketosteroid isomerase-like protein